MLPAFTSAMSRPRGIKGGKVYAAQQTWCIEGNYVTTQQIVDRDGRAYRSIKGVMAKLCKGDALITWQLIKETNS